MPTIALLMLMAGVVNGFYPSLPEGITPLEMGVAVAGFWMAWETPTQAAGIRRPWLLVLAGLLILIPSALLSWCAVLLLALSRFFNVPQGRTRQGYEILVWLGVFEIMENALLKFIAEPLLAGEAGLVRASLGWFHITATGFGNLVDVAGNKVVILLACSGLQNAVLAWITFRLAVLLALPNEKQYFVKQGLALFLSIMMINQIRLTLIALVPEAYGVLHGTTGAFVLDLSSLLVVAIALLSASSQVMPRVGTQQ